jgi:hypothetical protein
MLMGIVGAEVCLSRPCCMAACCTASTGLPAGRGHGTPVHGAGRHLYRRGHHPSAAGPAAGCVHSALSPWSDCLKMAGCTAPCPARTGGGALMEGLLCRPVRPKFAAILASMPVAVVTNEKASTVGCTACFHTACTHCPI